MGNEIKIDDSIIKHAEDFIPEVIRINRFMIALSKLYIDGFRSYQGKARQEVDAYGRQVLHQIEQLSNNYLCLSNELKSIVEAFMMADKNAEENINAFYEKIIESSLRE